MHNISIQPAEYILLVVLYDLGVTHSQLVNEKGADP